MTSWHHQWLSKRSNAIIFIAQKDGRNMLFYIERNAGEMKWESLHSLACHRAKLIWIKQRCHLTRLILTSYAIIFQSIRDSCKKTNKEENQHWHAMQKIMKRWRRGCDARWWRYAYFIVGNLRLFGLYRYRTFSMLYILMRHCCFIS